MPATALVAKTASGIGAGGTAVVAVAGDNVNGNSFVQDGHTLLRLTAVAAQSVTFPYPVLVDGQTVPTKTVSIGAGAVVYVAAGIGASAGFYPGGVITFTPSAATVMIELVNF